MLNQPPDFDEFMKVAIRVSELTTREETLKAELKIAEAEITKTCMTDPAYFDAKGNQPSMKLVEDRYHYTGLNGELTPKRLELAKITGELVLAELTFKVYSAMLELYRTESANKRTMV